MSVQSSLVFMKNIVRNRVLKILYLLLVSLQLKTDSIHSLPCETGQIEQHHKIYHRRQRPKRTKGRDETYKGMHHAVVADTTERT